MKLKLKLKLARKHVIFLAVAPFIIVFDQITKVVVVDRFRLGESISVIPKFFNLTYIRNKGAAFGLLADADPSFRIPFFLIIPVIALVVIGWVFRTVPASSIRMSSAVALVIGGAIGNLIDRVRLGYVIDFLDFHWDYRYHFPAFNVADTAICVGVGLLMLHLLKDPNASPSV